MAIDLVHRLLYRDAMLLIVDKPAGLPVHAGPGGGPNMEDGFDALRFGLPRLPALAHRLDRDTSGCLILGRHRKALARVGKLFQQGRIEKIYWAVVEGEPDAERGRIDAPLAKSTADKRSWRMKVNAGGQPALTDWRVLARGAGRAWIEFRPRTGRTHQIRVHASHAGWPVAGDPVYGRKPDADGVKSGGANTGGANTRERDTEAANQGGLKAGLLLHARAVSVPLYPNRPAVIAYAPPPAPFLLALLAMGADGTLAPNPFGPATHNPPRRTPPTGDEA